MTAMAFVKEHKYAIAGGAVVLAVVFIMTKNSQAATPRTIETTPTSGSDRITATGQPQSAQSRTLLQRVIDFVKPPSSTRQIVGQGTDIMSAAKASDPIGLSRDNEAASGDRPS